MWKMSFLFKKSERLYKLYMFFFKACHAACIYKIGSLYCKRLYVNCVVIFYSTREKQAVVNSIMHNLYIVVFNTASFKVFFYKLACRNNTIYARKSFFYLLANKLSVFAG